MKTHLKLLALCCALAIAGPAQAEPEVITGPAVALDGDTLLVGDRTVRLFGIDAPEMDSPYGWQARAVVDLLLADGQNQAECYVVEKDRHDRAVAVCLPAGEFLDIGRQVIAAGLAVPWRRYTWRGDAGSCPSNWISPDWTPADMARAGCYGAAYDAEEATARLVRAGRWADLLGPAPQDMLQ